MVKRTESKNVVDDDAGPSSAAKRHRKSNPPIKFESSDDDEFDGKESEEETRPAKRARKVKETPEVLIKTRPRPITNAEAIELMRSIEKWAGYYTDQLEELLDFKDNLRSLFVKTGMLRGD
jgi:hypothetical protein